jgi:hypothetical protein
MTKTFFEPNILADESSWTGVITPILDGLFVQHVYTGSLQGKPLTGTAIYGYQKAARRFQCIWMDSFHNGTAMMFCEGKPDDPAFSVTGRYDAPDGSPPWGWRTEIRMVTPDRLIISMTNIAPDGAEALAVETTYTRHSGQ